MSKRVLEFEFSFGWPERRSTAWKVVVPRGRSDVYLSNLDGRGEFHISLHERGRCHITQLSTPVPDPGDPWGGRATTADELPPELMGSKNRGYGDYLDVWYPKQLTPGLTLPLRVGIATSQLRLLPLEVAQRPTIRWVEVSPDPAWFNEVAFFLSDEDSEGWPGEHTMNTRLLTKHHLLDGRVLWLTSRSHPQSREDELWTHAYWPSVCRSPIAESIDRSKWDLSALVLTQDPAYNSFAIWETGE